MLFGVALDIVAQDLGTGRGPIARLAAGARSDRV